MSERNTGLLVWFQRWNRHRLQKKHWQRDLIEALADDDAAIMDALTRFLAEARDDRAGRAADQEVLVERIEAIHAGQEELARRLSDCQGRVSSLAELCKAVEQPPEARGPQSDTFPTIPTARAWLVEPELSVLEHLAPSLSPRLAFDVGAHHGRFSSALLDLGFEVHALEPNPAARAELVRRLGGFPGLTVHAMAAGAKDGQAELGLVVDQSGHYSDPTQFASLTGLPLPQGLIRSGSVSVPICRLDALVRKLRLAVPSVVKVDTEGYDLEVLRGLGELRPSILIAEFWDEELPFSGPGAQNRLSDLVAYAEAHGQPFHLVVFRRWGDDRPAFFSGYSTSPERSWGNVLFFTEWSLYEKARRHLATLIPEARFVSAPGAGGTGHGPTALR